MSNSGPDIPESERLFYKLIGPQHVTGQYLGWLNDPEVNKYLEVKKENTLEELRDYVNDAVAKKICFWAVHLKENGLHIGNIKVDPINRKHSTGELGLMMGEKSEWRKGYAKEASLAVINFCFTKLNLRKITLGIVENNVGSVTLYKNIGFITEGIYQQHGLYDGVYCNVVRMAMFNPSYKH